MIKERDFTCVTFKVNASGSWATLVHCYSERFDEVKAACVTLAQASGNRVKFKVVDACGGTIEEYSSVGYGQYGWHAPKRGRQ